MKYYPKRPNKILRLSYFSQEVFLIINNNFSYKYLYRVIARLQSIHSDENFFYKTEDLNAKQMAYLLNKLLNLQILSKEKFNEMKDFKLIKIDLLGNWENAVMELGTDENNRKEGKPPYFKPNVTFSDYELPNMRLALYEMDKHIESFKFSETIRFPLTPRENDIKYQLTLENWVSNAPLSDISKFLIKLHGLYYPEIDDLIELKCGVWSQDGYGATFCPKCEKFMLAVMAVGLNKRPELKKLIGNK